MSLRADDYTPGDHVRVTDGPLSDFEGRIETIDAGRNQLSVAVWILGRATPIRVEPWQVEPLR